MPWQVTHGLWVGWVVLAVLVVVGGALLWLWVRWGARRRANRALRAFGSVSSSFDLGPVVLRGRLEVPGAPVPALDGSGAAAACTIEASSDALRFSSMDQGAMACFRAPSLNLRTKEGLLSLRGGLMVAVGSRETLRGRLALLDEEDRERLLACPDDVVHFRKGKWPETLALPGMIRVLRHGDEVMVRGVVQHNTGDGGLGASYRPMGAAFEIVAPKGKDLIEVANCTVGRTVLAKPTLMLRALIAGSMVGLLFVFLLGESAHRVEDHALAALFPFHRAQALEALAQRAAHNPVGQDRLELVLAHQKRTPNCRRTGEALLAHGHWIEAGDMLATCENGQLSHRAALAYRMGGELGRSCELYNEYNELQDAPFLLSGPCEKRAAHVFRKASETAPKQRASTLRCLADSIDARAGDKQALDRLASQGAESCRLLHADLLEGQARLAALSVLGEAPPSEKARHTHPLLIRLFLTIEGLDPSAVILPSMPSVIELISNPDALIAGRALGLEQEALTRLLALEEPTPSQRSLRRYLTTWMAGFEVLAGNLQEAHKLLDRAESDGVQLRKQVFDPWQQVEEFRARAQIASSRVFAHVIAGELEKAREVMVPWSDLSSGRFLRDLPSSPELPAMMATLRADVAQPLDDALALIVSAEGKGSKNKEVSLQTASFLLGTSSSVDGFLATAPGLGQNPSVQLGLPLLVVKGRGLDADEGKIRQWLATESRQSRTSLASLLWEAALASRASEALGDLESSKRNQHAAQAYRQALSSRPLALTFALLLEE